MNLYLTEAGIRDKKELLYLSKAMFSNNLGKYLLRALYDLYPHLKDKVWSKNVKDPFRLLVITVLSQVTSYKNLMRAVENLDKTIGISPEKLAKASLEDIEKAIKPAGLYKQRAQKIKTLAQMIVNNYGGDLSFLKNLDSERARELLLALPGVGEKTADVLLLFSFNRRVMPVDAHIRRITRRLGLVGEKSSYREIRKKLEEIFPPEDLAFAHIALIEFGRNICRARKPSCNSCPLRKICPRIGVSDQKLDHTSRGEFIHHSSIPRKLRV